MTEKEALIKAINIIGGQSATARMFGIKQPSVADWVKSGKTPAERVIPLSLATGEVVTRNQLRPTLYPATELNHKRNKKV